MHIEKLGYHTKILSCLRQRGVMIIKIMMIIMTMLVLTIIPAHHHPDRRNNKVDLRGISLPTAP